MLLQPRFAGMAPAVAGLVMLGALPASAQNVPANETPSQAELVALVNRTIARQHQDDAALPAYERVERHVVRTAGSSPRILEDKTYRSVPTGTGTLKLLLRDDGHAVDEQTYRRELQTWVQVLEIATHPDDPRQKESAAKAEKKSKDRAALVDAASRAYRFTWFGRETRDGRVLDKLQLEPNPDFRPSSMTAEILTHARAIIWIDHETGHLARAEADIIRDVSFGGGILGKVYRGGHFEMIQSEVAPGLWLPTRYQYDFTGRKFLFTFGVHEFTEISQYRHDGPPSHALEIGRQDLASGRNFAGDP
jgi:hypothetical protein